LAHDPCEFPNFFKIKDLETLPGAGTSLVEISSASFVGISPRHLMTFPVTWQALISLPPTGQHSGETQPVKL
jgi:hypothetical protein